MTKAAARTCAPFPVLHSAAAGACLRPAPVLRRAANGARFPVDFQAVASRTGFAAAFLVVQI
jgi:hypothetical protein